jgi:hypothetical protein
MDGEKREEKRKRGVKIDRSKALYEHVTQKK